jgi:hypothetical protein
MMQAPRGQAEGPAGNLRTSNESHVEGASRRPSELSTGRSSDEFRQDRAAHGARSHRLPHLELNETHDSQRVTASEHFVNAVAAGGAECE